MKTPPAFFKFFIAGLNDKDLKIPPAFIESLKQALPEKVYLRDRYDNVWKVKVGKVGNYRCFLDGWVKFSRDNFLNNGDMLLFEYYSDSWFNVLIFGPSATEKEVPFMRKGKEKQEEHVSEFVDEYNENDDGDGGDYDDDTETEDYIYAITNRLENETQGDFGDVYDDEETEQTSHREVITDGASASRNTSQISFRRDWYGVEIFRAGLARQPINPYFVTKVMQKRKADLFVPKEVIKDFNLDLTEEITLVDPTKREFRANCRKWSDGRVVISGGWKSLCRLNLVTQDDRCICEFVQGEGRCLFLNVSFVRGANVNRD